MKSRLEGPVWWGRILRFDDGTRVPAIAGGGGGSAGSTRTTQQVSQTDPWLSRINELAYGQISQGVEQTGGLPAYLRPNPYALPSSEELGLYGQVAGRVNQPLMTDLESQGLEGLRRAADPNLALQSARSLYEQYAAPVVQNQAIASGVGRSGAVPEALASGFAGLTLPIIQGAGQAGQELARTSLLLGPALEQRGLSRIEQAIQATQAPRLAQSAEYLRPLQTVANLVGGLPVGGGNVTGYMTGRTAASRGDFDVLGDLLIPLVGAVVGGAAGCWISVAILGPVEAIWSRLYVVYDAPWYVRASYRLLGPLGAKFARGSRRVSSLLKPMVAGWAHKGRLAWTGK